MNPVAILLLSLSLFAQPDSYSNNVPAPVPRVRVQVCDTHHCPFCGNEHIRWDSEGFGVCLPPGCTWGFDERDCWRTVLSFPAGCQQ